MWNEAISVDRWQNRELGPEKSFAERFNNRIVETVVANFGGNHEGMHRKYWREKLFLHEFLKVFIDDSTVGWPKQSHFMTAWFGKIFPSIYRLASFLRDLPRARFDDLELYIHYRFVPFESAPCCKILPIYQGWRCCWFCRRMGNPAPESWLKWNAEKGQKMDWAVKLALHSLVVSRCYLGSTYILRFVTFIFIIFQSFSYLFQCCTVRNRLEISANRDQSSRASLSTMIWIAATKCVCCMHLYAILWSNDALLASNPPLSKCHRSVLVIRACALVHAFWCLLSST